MSCCVVLKICSSTKLHGLTSEKTVDVDRNDVYTALEQGARLGTHY